MTTRPVVSPRRVSRLTALSRVASVLVIIGGGVVLVGWQLDLTVLTTVLPGRVAMNPVTALTFALAGGVLWLSCPAGSPLQPEIRRAALAAAGLVMLMGVVTLAGYLIGENPGLDQILFTDRLGGNRIAPNTGLNFVLVGAALGLLDWEVRRPTALLRFSHSSRRRLP